MSKFIDDEAGCESGSGDEGSVSEHESDRDFIAATSEEDDEPTSSPPRKRVKKAMPLKSKRKRLVRSPANVGVKVKSEHVEEGPVKAFMLLGSDDEFVDAVPSSLPSQPVAERKEAKEREEKVQHVSSAAVEDDDTTHSETDEERGRDSQTQYWCFTENNPSTLDDGQAFLDSVIAAGKGKVSFCVLQYEVGSKNGTPHYQGYIEFKTKQRFTAVKKLLPRARISMRRRTRLDNVKYCTKSRGRLAGPWQYGELPPESQQGARSDLKSACALVRTKGIAALVEEMPDMFVRYGRNMMQYANFSLPKYDMNAPEPLVTLLYGPPGCGKTLFFHQAYGDEPYHVVDFGNGFWFDGYNQQKYVLFDEFGGKGNPCSLDAFLQLIDRYPKKVTIKGAMVNWIPSSTFIASNLHPLSWYDFNGVQARRIDAVKRRVSRVIAWRHTVLGGFEKQELKRPGAGEDREVWDAFWAGPPVDIDRQYDWFWK